MELPKYPLIDEWKMRTWYISIIEYCSFVRKNHEISDKGIGLENIILSEVICDMKIKMSWRGPIGKQKNVKIGEE